MKKTSIKKLWSEVKKILELGRGYKLEKILEEKKDSIEALFRKPKRRVYVSVTTRKISVQKVRRIVARMEEYDCNEGLLATIRNATPQAKKEAEENRIEIIDSKQPLIYIFDHWLVPKHRLLSEDEARKVIEKYAGGDRSLAMRIFPKILTSDPAVRILKAKPGQIIEIRRTVPPLKELQKRFDKHTAERIHRILRRLIPAGEEIYYRIVVEG